MRALIVTVALCAAAALPLHGPAHRLGTVPRQADPPRRRASGSSSSPTWRGWGAPSNSREILAGNEGAAYKAVGRPTTGIAFALLLTQEVNATIAGARAGGAASFVVNEGHGGNLFANVLPWDLDSSAMLVRGFPKPLVMVTGIDTSFGTLMFTGAHANAGSRA